MARPLHQLLNLLTLGAVALASPSVWAVQDASSTVKPLAVFLLDTSGSMEYESGNATNAASEFTVPRCEEPGQGTPSLFEPGAYPKSRLIVAKEVLTGSYRDYWCRYDYRDQNAAAIDYEYPVPHIEACSGTVAGACTVRAPGTSPIRPALPASRQWRAMARFPRAHRARLPGAGVKRVRR